ncbi:unnamed protein product [Hymenolepis diminuta]|uniref:Aldo_ket_red domain-containing protein n=1 Tax=Hymenolepis diminuta TaxID=6216 RepID=A0A158QC91_HYMDI|nr:unnamed protein product [Hymenolepis diminuta]
MAEKITTLAYNSGVNYFDTSEFYSEGRRSSYVVCTKLLRYGSAPTEITLSRKRIIEVLIARDPDRICTIEEIVRACTFAVQQGWAFYWGTSNWSPDDIMEAHAIARLFHLIPPSMECLEFNLFQREFHECGLPELCSKLGLGLVSGAPLARGLLSGKYEERIPRYSRASLQGQKEFREYILSKEGQDKLSQVSQLSKLANRLGISLPQLSIAWCLKSNQVNSVILGAATVDQLQENLGALSAVSSLTNAVLGEIENILISDHQSTEDFL